jgi:hypothetical protein
MNLAPFGRTLKAMKSGLFELRMRSKEGIGRVLHCTLVGKRIIMLYSFIRDILLLYRHCTDMLVLSDVI